jgi:hypothetical protein
LWQHWLYGPFLLRTRPFLCRKVSENRLDVLIVLALVKKPESEAVKPIRSIFLRPRAFAWRPTHGEHAATTSCGTTIQAAIKIVARSGVSGSSSGQAVGFDPGGLSHFCRANPATVKFRGRQLRRLIPTFRFWIAVRHRRLRGAFRRFMMGGGLATERAPARAPPPAIPGLSDGQAAE